jgi:hypothetical protein
MHRLDLTAEGAAAEAPRVGGGALLGGIADWPRDPFGRPLVLVASLPADFVAEKMGIDLGAGRVASAFTTYPKGEYFLDQITYHGDPSELALLRKGATQVLVHERGDLVHGAIEMPARCIAADTPADEDVHSMLGGEARLLQEESLAIDGLAFALQIYGGDLPESFRDLFYLTDGIGYLYLPASVTKGTDRTGLFFVQVT